MIILKPEMEIITLKPEMEIISKACFNTLVITHGWGEAKAKAMCSLYPHSVWASTVKSK